MKKLKTGIASYDQNVGRLAMLDSIITHWNINQERGYGNDDFTSLLNEFKANVSNHLDFLDTLIEEEAVE